MEKVSVKADELLVALLIMFGSGFLMARSSARKAALDNE